MDNVRASAYAFGVAMWHLSKVQVRDERLDLIATFKARLDREERWVKGERRERWLERLRTRLISRTTKSA